MRQRQISKTPLVDAHTRMMHPIEECLARMLAKSGNDFSNMNDSQAKFYEEKSAEWDKMKADRDMAKLVDAGGMTLAEFNAKKLHGRGIQVTEWT